MGNPKKFKRGFDSTKDVKFFKSLLWQAIINARYGNKPTFQVCIRDNYLNVYWKGCSVLRYRRLVRTNEDSFSIHYKYLGLKGSKRSDSYEYFEIKKGDEGVEDLFCNELPGWSFKNNVIKAAEKGNINEITRKSKDTYVVGEKKGIAQYIQEKSPFLLDLEVAFSRNNGKKNIADRVDLARLNIRDPDFPVLELVEVKLASNKCLRSKQEDGVFKEGKIMHQMKRYENFLFEQKNDIKESYKAVAKNYLELGMGHLLCYDDVNYENVLRRFIENAEKNELVLDHKPYLLIIGSKDELNGRNGGNHLDQLKIKFKGCGYPEIEMFEYGVNEKN